MIRANRHVSSRGLLALGLVTAFLSSCASTGIPAREIEIDGPDGSRLWQLEPEGDEVELEDAESKDLVSFRYKPDHISFKDTRGKRFEVIREGKGPAVALRDEKSRAVVLRLSREPDGDWELESTDRRWSYEIKVRDYGYKVEGGGTERKVREREGKISIRDSDDNTHLSSRSRVSTLALACFACEGLPVEFRAALCLAVERWRLDRA